MPPPSDSKQREREAVAPSEEAGVETHVYCKGCGTPLESRARFTHPRTVVTTMMCESCRQIHGHDLMPTPGSPTFCYRCGGPEEVFVATGTTPGNLPATYHVCPRCRPEQYERFRAGDFETPKPPPK